jgi:NAD(P)-dependent dehydrogenase (short-subunit alcohol dehydrogenase family)
LEEDVMEGLSGKVGIVTGAASGIGRATAMLLAREGVSVVVADINGEGAEETVRLIEKDGGVALARVTDVYDEESIAGAVAAAVDMFGSLQLLHNNAIDVAMLGRDGPVTQMEVEVWDRTMAVNLRGPMLGCKHAIPHMIAAGGGAIVTTSSAAGQLGDLALSAYGVCKAGIDNLTRYVATQYGKQNIRCNTVAPGLVRTPMMEANLPKELVGLYESNHLTPSIGRPENIADAVVFLLSDGAKFITGQRLNVDGGLTIHNPLYSNLASQG